MGSRLVGPNMSDSKSQKAHWQIERNKQTQTCRRRKRRTLQKRAAAEGSIAYGRTWGGGTSFYHTELSMRAKDKQMQLCQ